MKGHYFAKWFLKYWYLMPLVLIGVALDAFVYTASAAASALDALSDRVCGRIAHAYEQHDSRDAARNVRSLWKDIDQWSQKTFGTDYDRGPIGPLKHIKLECDEAMLTDDFGVYDKKEFADIGILWIDACRRAGLSLGEVLDAMRDKMRENKLRTWPTPTSDEPVRHLDAA